MRHKLVIWGTGGHALVVADIVRLQNEYELVGFLDNVYPERHHMTFCGVPVLGGEEQLGVLHQHEVSHLLLGFGNCHARLKIAKMLSEKGFCLATAIHPKAILASDVQIGVGSVIAAAAVVNPGTVIGENVIINTSASVDHECFIENGVHICPGVHLAGTVSIGQATKVGIGATVINHIRIGRRSVIGAGAVVVHDIPDDVIAYGVPAIIVRKVEHDDV